MDYRFLLSLAKRMVAILSYLVLNAAFSLAFVLLTMRIAYGNDDSPALGLVMFMEFAIVFSMGLLWGLIYLSAFLKKSGSISVWSIWRRLGLSYLFGLLCLLPLYGALSFPLPNFRSQLATSSYLFLLFSLSLLCFLAGLMVRVNLHFRRKRRRTRRSDLNTENACTPD
jgi:hypothetical protein